MRSLIRDTISSKSAVLCLCLVLLQQLLVASSTAWIVKLVHAIEQGEHYSAWLALYLASLALPYLPGGAALVCLTKWQNQALERYTSRFLNAISNAVAHWNDGSFKKSRLTALQAQAQPSLNDFCEYVYRLWATTLNVALSVTVLAWIAGPTLLLAYTFSVFLGYGLLVLRRNQLNALATSADASRANLLSTLGQCWQNVLLGNAYNLKLWRRDHGASRDAYNKTSVGLAVATQSTSIGLALLTFAPSAAVISCVMIRNQGDMAKLLALCVALPRFFMALNNTYEFLSSILAWTGHNARMRSLEAAASAPPAISLEDRLRWDQITLEHSSTPRILVQASPKALNQMTQSPGRITIRGSNGAGKSTLLTLFRAQNPARCTLIPAHPELTFASNIDHASSGERLNRILREISASDSGELLLLDEWDANLDDANMIAMDQLIDALSVNRCVIEVRHRA